MIYLLRNFAIKIIYINIYMKIILQTLLKVGSTTLSYVLQEKYGYVERWENENDLLEYYNNNSKFLLRGHFCPNYEFINNNFFDIRFTIIKKPTEIYLSGFFQDINNVDNNPDYDYCYGDQDTVLNADNHILLNHFLKYNWNSYRQFNYDYNFDEIFKHTDINIWEQDFDKEKGFSIYCNNEKNIKVCVLTIESLDKIKEILSELQIFTDNEITIDDLKLNESSKKWYKDKYIEVKKLLPKSYFEKYKDIDNKIINKFYKT